MPFVCRVIPDSVSSMSLWLLWLGGDKFARLPPSIAIL